MAPLIKSIAAQDDTSPAAREVVECWVSPNWSDGLTVDRHPEWPDVKVPDSGGSGLVSVLVARDAGRHRVSVCGYLVDVFCLGVKNTIGPHVMDRHALTMFARSYFDAYHASPLAVPMELVQHLVFGAVEYARDLGFEPAAGSDFETTKDHLGQWTGPSAIRFGRDCQPFFVEGPHDNAAKVVATLRRSVGPDNFHYLVGAERSPAN
ncbi:MAG: helix-turn-helix domain-containing protein [Actinophytocola sp.]|nr:helix-turn-helix domain-containing protein [Actinophytocola sp.]